jgi:hypothetical protein
VAAQSKALVCGHSLAEVACSSPAEGMELNVACFTGRRP